jgi:dsDNA-binding SOS-regulon protein
MTNLCKGLLATSLSMALFVGGAVVGAAAQATSHDHAGAAQSSPAAVPENPSSPSTMQQSSPAATLPDQDNGVRQSPDKDERSMQQVDRDRDAKAQDRDRDAAQGSKEGNDLTKQEVKTWDKFLDSHPEIAQELQKDPQKVNDPSFVSQHSELQTFLTDHPKVREELKENPSKVMNREKAYERTEDKK